MLRKGVLLASLLVLVSVLLLASLAEAEVDEEKIRTFFQKGGSHTNNWAVLVRLFNRI